MPKSNYLLMEDFLAFKSIANTGYHLHFTSDIMNAVEGEPPHKIIRPLANLSAKMDYYLIFKKENQKKMLSFFNTLNINRESLY